MALYKNPPGIEPAKLPHPNEDPAHLAARAAKADYLRTAQTARGDWRSSELDRAERINKAYQTYTAALQRLFEDLTAQRRKRLEWAEQQVPFGPGIAADTSPADRAVLQTAFRNALERARAAGLDERFRLLREAEAFDDDMMRRAVLTVAAEQMERQLLDEWAAARPGMVNLLNEVMALREGLMGRGSNRGYERQDFFPERAPQEVHDLPRLRAAQERLEERRRQDVARAAAARSHFRP